MLDWEQAFVASQRVARLATLGPGGQPHVLPIVYAFDGQRLYTPLDAKPKRVPGEQLARVRNIEADARVAVVVDSYHEDWQCLVWVQIRGRAALLTEGGDYDAAIALLLQKYPQYQALPLTGRAVIAIHPEQVRSWRANSPPE